MHVYEYVVSIHCRLHSTSLRIIYELFTQEPPYISFSPPQTMPLTFAVTGHVWCKCSITWPSFLHIIQAYKHIGQLNPDIGLHHDHIIIPFSMLAVKGINLN